MNYFGKHEQEQAMQKLIHDTNRDLCQLDHVINKLSAWVSENTKAIEDAGIKTSYPHVAIQYLKEGSKWIKNDIDDYLKKWEKFPLPQPVKDDWVSVEDRLPEEGMDVLVTDGFACMVMVYKKKEFSNYGKIDWWDNKDVTHWQPLPPTHHILKPIRGSRVD